MARQPDSASLPLSAPAPLSASATVLALDYGARRIGVAVGDAGLRTAHPIGAIAASSDAARFAQIEKLVATWQPRRLVIGLPLAPDGSHGESARRAERFARQLEARFGLPVARVDERYSSHEAESRLREAAGARRAARASRARELDAYAAQLILQQWFDEAPARMDAR
jgi:putative Holliday junction resolvase